MILLWAGLIVAGVAALAITAMLLVRRRAPTGSYFEDGDRAARVFGVLVTAPAWRANRMVDYHSRMSRIRP